jgi:hypothetical protein
MNKTRWFPDWVPSLRSWMMAIKLAVPAYCCATVVLAFEVWRFFLLGGIFAMTGTEGLAFFFLISIGALLLSLVWFLALAGLYALILKALWSNPPQWLRLPKIETLVNRDFGILVSSVFPISVMFLIYAFFSVSFRENLFIAKPLRLTYDLFLLKFAWVWLISAACSYQGYLTTRLRLSNRRKSLSLRTCAKPDNLYKIIFGFINPLLRNRLHKGRDLFAQYLE